jgi:hypothetical protein
MVFAREFILTSHDLKIAHAIAYTLESRYLHRHIPIDRAPESRPAATMGYIKQITIQGFKR